MRELKARQSLLETRFNRIDERFDMLQGEMNQRFDMLRGEISEHFEAMNGKFAQMIALLSQGQ